LPLGSRIAGTIPGWRGLRVLLLSSGKCLTKDLWLTSTRGDDQYRDQSGAIYRGKPTERIDGSELLGTTLKSFCGRVEFDGVTFTLRGYGSQNRQSCPQGCPQLWSATLRRVDWACARLLRINRQRCQPPLVV